MSDETRAPVLVVPKLSGESNKLTLGQIWFAAWCALPEWEREPWSKTDLARRLGISRSTLYAWWRNENVIKAIRTLGRRTGEREYGRVIGAIIRAAIAGSVTHARLYFELMGDLGPRAIRAGADVEIDVYGTEGFDQRKVAVSHELAARIAESGHGDGAGAG